MKKKMTYDEFFRMLAKTPRTWRLYDVSGYGTGWIRSNQTCPISRVAGMSGLDFVKAGSKLGLTPQQGGALAAASDNLKEWRMAGDGATYKTPVSLRKRMLKACGLKEAHT